MTSAAPDGPAIVGVSHPPLARVPLPAVPHRAWTVLRYDVPASLVVFLVAVPLSLGIAVATGAPVMAGLIAAVVGGIVAGLLGGSPLQVSGPAAGLTVVVADLIAKFGWGVTCAITVAAGLLQVVFGLSRVARAALAISPAVVHAQQVRPASEGEPACWRVVVEGTLSFLSVPRLTRVLAQVPAGSHVVVEIA